MSDTAVNPTTPPANVDGMLLDGEAPRLGSVPILTPAPMGGVGTAATSDQIVTDAAPPAASSVLAATEASMDPTAHPRGEQFAANAPTTPLADLPTLPTLPTAALAVTSGADGTTAPTHAGAAQHPMAHLMPAKSKPTEASIRAAEQRAVKKAKAKKVKLTVTVGALIVAVLAGPPLVSWLTNAINESGGLETEEPAD